MVTPVAENRRSELARSFESIFRTGNPYTQPFRPEIVGRLLLFPIFDCALEEEQFEAVSRAAAGLGERQGFALVGGQPAFVAETKEHLDADEDEMAREWLAYWRGH